MSRLLQSPVSRALVAPHGVDGYLEALHPMWSVRDVRAEVLAVDHPTPDAVTLTLRPNRNWRGFRAGQHARFSVDIDGIRRERTFSLASSPHREDGRLEITARVHPGGLVSRHFKNRVRPGVIVGMSQATGAFTLPWPRPEHLLLISGGSGVTPVLSMLRSLCDENHAGHVTFLHYARAPHSMLYAAELAELSRRRTRIELVRSFTRESAGGELSGRFSESQLRTVAPEFARAQTYVSGPPGLARAVEDLYRANGLDDRLYVETFHPPAARTSCGTGEPESRVVDFTAGASDADESLLEQAEKRGIFPNFGCRRGVCRICTAKKISGVVRDLRTGRLSDAGEERIQLCTSAPCGAVSVRL